MDKEYWEQRYMEVYWWNFGKRTLDYKGDYAGFLRAKGIEVEEVESHHYRFRISVSSATVSLETFCGYCHAVDEAILIFLTLLGDKATFSSGPRNYHVNWR